GPGAGADLGGVGGPRRDAEEPAVGVEDVEEREEVVLGRPPAVEEDQRALRVGSRFPDEADERVLVGGLLLLLLLVERLAGLAEPRTLMDGLAGFPVRVLLDRATRLVERRSAAE